MSIFNAFWAIAANTWNEYMQYRLNFVMWRVRHLVKFLVIYFLWWAIFSVTSQIFGYDQTKMLTYILLVSFVSDIVFSTKTADIGAEIIQGNISNLLIKPFHVWYYWIARDIGDKVLNILFSFTEICLLIMLLKPPLFIQTNIFILFQGLIALVIAVILYFLVSLLISFIAFWSPEVWGPRFILFILIDFFAGGLFPLDILPLVIFKIFRLLPFTYFLYFPIKIYLGQLSIFEIFQGLTIGVIWIFLLLFLVQKVWKKGLVMYEAQGR